MSDSPLQQLVDENPDWIKRWLLCQKEADNGNPVPLVMLQIETQIDLAAEERVFLGEDKPT